MSDKRIIYNHVNNAWLDKLYEILNDGNTINPRGEQTREIIGLDFAFNMEFPILSINERNLGYKFLFAEAWWILSGRNDVKSIKPYSKVISNFSDDGVFFRGAYGPMVVEQLSYVIEKLAKDHSTRQAVMTIWRPNPPATKDFPCTVSVQWLIRDGKIHCLDSMRSSDIWLGVPYDVFNFTMLTTLIALYLNHHHGTSLELGNFYFHANSGHLYDRNIERAREVLNEHSVFEYDCLRTVKFFGPNDFMSYLERAKDHKFMCGDWAKCISGRKGERNDNWY